MTPGLQGKRVLVTAGASGIGRRIAEAFAAAGCSVTVCDISGDAIDDLSSANPGIAALEADVTDTDAIAHVFAQLDRHGTGLDILVNNAGVTGPFKAIEDIALEEWRHTMDVNINGMFYVTRLAMPRLIANGGGAIINVSSVAGRLGFPYRTGYAASKWAIIGLTKSLAMEAGPRGVRVNAILPGFVAGPRNLQNTRRRAERAGITEEEQRAKTLAKISTRTLTEPEDVANMALFLASDLGVGISGQAMSVCGNVETMGGDAPGP